MVYFVVVLLFRVGPLISADIKITFSTLFLMQDCCCACSLLANLYIRMHPAQVLRSLIEYACLLLFPGDPVLHDLHCHSVFTRRSSA